MDLFSKIRNILKKESPFKGESDEFLYLIRLITLLLGLYYLFLAVILMANTVKGYYMPVYVSAILLFGVLISTYRIHPSVSLYMLSIVATLSSGVLTYAFGFRASFHYVAYVVLFIFWYNPLDSVKRKLIYSVFIAVMITILTVNITARGLVYDFDGVWLRVVIVSNILFSVSIFSVVAFFFCTKYVEAERMLRMYNKQLKKLSETDALTRLMNRRSAMDELADMEKQFNALGTQFCVSIGDIDFFKKVNDTYGHDAGDYILFSLGQLFTEYMKHYGFVARWGGEEFLFAFTGLNGDEAQVALDNLLVKIRKAEFDFGGTKIKITMTFGVEEYDAKIGLEKIIKSADEKLYLGKQSGRNIVIF